MRVGDMVRRGWCVEKRCIAPPFKQGIILNVGLRSLQHYTAEEIADDPIRHVDVLVDGKIKRWYAVHVEVINENRRSGSCHETWCRLL